MQQSKKIPALDTLRFIFIFGIMLFHAGGAFENVGGKYLGPVYAFGGYFGNYFFFILSGFLTARAYRTRISDGGVPLGRFLWGRISKFYALFLASELIAIVCAVIKKGLGVITLKHLLTDALLITTGWIEQYTEMYNMPTWFLCVLVLCYVLYYLLARAAGKRRYVYLIACGFLAVFGRYLENKVLFTPFLYRFVGEGYMNFFLGCLLYEGVEALEANEKRRKQFTIGAWAVLAFIIVFTLFLGAEAFWGDTVASVSFLCMLIIFLTLETGWLRGLLDAKPFRPFQKISVEVFLLHFPLLTAYMLLVPYTPLHSANNAIKLLVYLFIVVALSFAVSCLRSRRARLDKCINIASQT